MDNWITVITFVYPQEAYLAKSMLENYEIEVFIKDELTTQVNNFYSTAIGGVKLQVPLEDRDRALKLLQEAGYINEPEEPEEELTFPSEYASVCPYCQSENVSKKKQPGYIFVFSFLLLGLPLPFLRKSYHCFECGKSWKVKRV